MVSGKNVFDDLIGEKGSGSIFCGKRKAFLKKKSSLHGDRGRRASLLLQRRERGLKRIGEKDAEEPLRSQGVFRWEPKMSRGDQGKFFGPGSQTYGKGTCKEKSFSVGHPFQKIKT